MYDVRIFYTRDIMVVGMLKMWLSAVVVCGLLGLCVAGGYQPGDPQGQAYPNYPSPFSNYPSSNSGSYRQPLGDDAIVAQLDRLLNDIEKIDETERLQKPQIGGLREVSDRNRAFQDSFKDVASKDINNEILEQNDRLNNLDNKLATIRGLRTQVDNLQNTVERVRNVTEKTIAADIKVLDRLGNLREDGLANDIQEAYQEALRISAGLDEMLRKLYVDIRQIIAQQLDIDQLIARLDYSTFKATEVSLNVDKNGLATANVTHPGFPEFYHGFLIGLDYSFRNYSAPEQREVISKEVLFSNPGSNVTQVLLIDNSPSHQDTVLVLAFNPGPRIH